MNEDRVGTYLGQKGYSIYKECLDMKDQQYLRDELTVGPYIPKAPVQPIPFPIYRESNNKIYIPRYFGINTYGEPDEIRTSGGDDIDLTFAGDLRDYQHKVVDTFLKNTNPRSGGGGLLEIPCGRGKTVIALNIVSRIKKKTLVIVHKSFLLNQWIERIEQFLPGTRVGKIQGQIIDMEDIRILLLVCFNLCQ